MLAGTTVVPNSFPHLSGAKDGYARNASQNTKDARGTDGGTSVHNDNITDAPLLVVKARAPTASRTRIEPIDSRLRLHFRRTQAGLRSRANFGNTHMVASHPHPVNVSMKRFVDAGLSFVEARKEIARATREAHHRFVHEGEQELAKEMSLRDIQDRARNAHTFGTATLTNKIERMHRRAREKQAREILDHDMQVARTSAHDGGKCGRTLPSQLPDSIIGGHPRASAQSNPLPIEEAGSTDFGNGRTQYISTRDCDYDSKRSVRGVSGGDRERASSSLEGEPAGALGGSRKGKDLRMATDVCFLLRNLYKRGELDAQQQGCKSLPVDLMNTLTLQLETMRKVVPLCGVGSIFRSMEICRLPQYVTVHRLGILNSKINMPRNNLEYLTSLQTPSFSCEHMRSVTEMNLSGNKLREFPDEARRLTSLRTLRLDNNKLSGLPESLLTLTSLTSLSLRHNNFSNLPYRFGDLRSLQKLDLGENILNTLPATMVLLTSLKHLKLDGNNIFHLALPPLLKTSDGKDHSTKWKKRWNRKNKKEMWMNDVTGETSEVDPTSASTDRSSSATVFANSGLVPGTFDYNTRRNYLAERGIYEWEAALDISTGKVYYANNVNFSTKQAMPACMDRVGEMSNLVTLKISQNKLRSLPSSICSCYNLEVVEANDNYIENLPPKIGDMKRLRCLRSIVKLERLEELFLTNNVFAVFPEYVMRVSSLKKLLLGNNQLEKLPYSVGFLSSLETLQLYNNPLADPPAELLLLGMDALLRECRERHWARVRGPPPVVRVHGFGIEEEKLELQPEFDRKLTGCIEAAGRTGELNFMMEGLTYFPMGVFQEEIGRKLKSLRLDSNDLSSAAIVFRYSWEDLDKTTHSVSLCNLLVLSLKNCKLRRLDNSVAELVGLKELYLENNRILQLPETVTKLRMLEILDVKKNRLQDCPDNIGSLSRLKRLELDGNRLETLPPSLSQLLQLQVLMLSSNHVYQFPDDILALEQLETLDASRNMIRFLPSGFGALRLRSLKLSYNRLETLRHEVFRPSLKSTLQQLWLSNNNLLQLPDSLTELSKTKEVNVDFNPFKSPPRYVLGEGFTTVVQYLRVRMKRIVVMHDLILERGFDTSLEFLQPEACGVLRSDTGYLSPEDLDEVDKTVDSFLNGNFYRHPLSAEAILDAVLELRVQDTRAREFYDIIVYHLVARVLFHETREDFSENVYCRNTSRPWGRNRAPVGCFAIALTALFDDAAPNIFVKEFREALWTEVKKTLPRSVFEYSRLSLRKALTTTKSAYGPIARFEDVTFDFCECVDPTTGRAIRHPKGECRVPSLVIVKIIYTPEEAQRRKEEHREMIEAFKKSREQVSEWLKMKPGHSRAKDELSKRNAAKQLRVGTIVNTIKTPKATLKLKKEMLAFAQMRKSQFEKGGPFTFHNLASAEQATALVEAAQKGVADVESEVKALTGEKDQLKADLQEDMMVKVETDLQDKYCYVEYAEIMRRNRTIALKRGWRRPWDGMDGQDFIEWAKTIGCIAAASHERPENVADYVHMEEPINFRDWEETQSELTAKLNWEGTDNMGVFLVPRLVEWKEKRAAELLQGLDEATGIGSYDDEEEDGSQEVDSSRSNGKMKVEANPQNPKDRR